MVVQSTFLSGAECGQFSVCPSLPQELSLGANSLDEDLGLTQERFPREAWGGCAWHGRQWTPAKICRRRLPCDQSSTVSLRPGQHSSYISFHTAAYDFAQLTFVKIQLRKACFASIPCASLRNAHDHLRLVATQSPRGFNTSSMQPLRTP